MRRNLTAVGAMLLLNCPASAAPTPAGADLVVEDFGAGLLDDELARALDPSASAGAPATPAADWIPGGERLGRLLEQGALETAGEDVGGSPLAGVVRGMRRAESLIRDDADDKAATPVQRGVVTELERLIAQMEKQCNGSCNNKNPSQDRQASKRSQPKPGQCDKPGQRGKPGQQAKAGGQKPNQSGTTTLGDPPTADGAAAPQELVKAAWGHLPERMREQMLQSSDSEFLPEYREELERYFRRLAERPVRESP